MARSLARGRVVQGSALDLAIRLAAGVLKDAGGGGDGSGGMVGSDVSTDTAGGGRRKASRLSRLLYDGEE